MLIEVAVRLARRLPQRVASDWTTVAAIALAVVLVHSAWLHLASAGDIEAYYLERFGAAHWARLAGVAQLAIALGLLARRSRPTACAMLIAIVALALVARAVDGPPDGGWLPSIAIAAAAATIGIGETRRARRAATQADYSRKPDG